MNNRAAIDALFARLGPECESAQRRLREEVPTLYQFSTCPFCSKVRTFLDVYGIPYRVVEVDPFSKKELKGLAKGKVSNADNADNNSATEASYSKVPVLAFRGGPTLVDSAEIVTILSSLWPHPSPRFKRPFSRERGHQSADQDTAQWREWATQCLARYITGVMNGSVSDAKETLRWVASLDMPGAMKAKLLSAGVVMVAIAHTAIAGKLRAAGYPLKNPRQEFISELDMWGVALGGKLYHGGQEPDIADTDVYGVLRVLQGHRLFDEVTAEVAPPTRAWLARMGSFKPSRVV